MRHSFDMLTFDFLLKLPQPRYRAIFYCGKKVDLFLLPLAMKLREGNVFTPVCHSVHGGLCPGGSVQGCLCP